MAFADYTTPDEVRSLLGANPKELTDAIITTNTYLTTLLGKLDDLDPALVSAFMAAKDAEAPTAAQARFVLLVQTYCTYVVAIALVPSLPNLLAKRITDGKAETERHNPYASLLPDLTVSLNWVRAKVQTALGAVTGTAPATRAWRTMVANVPLGTDPITG